MQYTVTIDGETITPVEQDTFQLTSILGQTIGTARLRIYDKNCSIEVPEQKDIIISRNDTGERVFGGLSSIPEGWIEGVSRWWEVSCQDYTILLETIIFLQNFASGFTYDDLTGDQAIIANLFEKCVVGIDGGGSAASEIDARTYVGQAIYSMASQMFYYNTARESMTTICNYTGWNFQVDAYKRLHYFYREDTAAPYGLSSSPDGVNTIGYNRLRWKRDGTYVRNAYLIFGANLLSNPNTYIIAANGSDTEFDLNPSNGDASPQIPNVALAAPPGSMTIEVYINTGDDITPVWTQQDCGIDGVDSMPPVDCLHHATQQTLTFDTPPPNLTNSIKVVGCVPFTGGMPDYDLNSISHYGRSFAKRIVASDANSIAALQQKVGNYKQQFSWAVEVATLTVDEGSFPAGNSNRFEVGQWVPLYNAKLNINKSYVIYKIVTTIIGGQLVRYEMELRSWITVSA